MKRFVEILAVWLVVMLVGTFLFGALILDGSVYLPAVLLAVVFAVLTWALSRMSDQIDALEKRLSALEEKTLDKHDLTC